MAEGISSISPELREVYRAYLAVFNRDRPDEGALGLINVRGGSVRRWCCAV